MGSIDLKRVVLAGLLAGLVLNVADFLLFGMYLGADFDAAMQALGKEPPAGSMIAWWVALDFLWGILLVYLYAAIRPRFGPGPGTAIRAGVLLWIAAVLFHTIGEAPMGLFPQRLYVIGAVASLIYMPIVAVIGAWMYKEVESGMASG